MPRILHVTNWGSRAQHGPGRRLCAMARPRAWEHGDGTCNVARPPESAFLAWRNGQDLDAYRARVLEWWSGLEEAGKFEPGRLRCILPRPDGRHDNVAVADGDTLLCACPRPDSPRRTHPCHLEWLAPYLVRAGWGVILYGSEVTP
ncbi:MAG: hypothetical protein ABIL09_23570 [Gemmatimonadota bacterium]